jgi:ABC-type dipeptide/oligopeptide/nickel transport system ATPase subunit
MKINLPTKKGNPNTNPELDFEQLVVIGANGSGKTRFGAKIEESNHLKTHRISAQKSLSMPKLVRPTSIDVARNEFFIGSNHPQQNVNDSLDYKKNNRWGSNINTHLLNDFEKLLVLLHTEEYESLSDSKEKSILSPKTKIDIVREIWEKVLPHRKLKIKAGVVETFPISQEANKYNASEMSDGERVIFYLIAEVVCSPENSIVIIDEPEMHIHKSLVKSLFDLIENERNDCVFVYLTHDIDFAFSRQNARKVWAKSYEGSNVWDYEFLEDNTPIPEQLYLEILGSRKPILFIEGDNSKSIDEKLLELIFSDYTVKPLGSCQKVFSTTKAFNEQSGFHHIESFGLIDRDRRTSEEVIHIKNPNIWVARVAEIENFLLLEKVIKEVALNMMKNPDDVFENVKSNIITFFDSQKEKQALEHTLARVERLFKNATNNSEVKSILEFKTSLTSFWTDFNVEDIYDKVLSEFKKIIDLRDYETILKVFNNKGIVSNSQVVTLCDLNTKNDAYLNYVIGLLKQKSNSSDKIKEAIVEKIEK